MKLVRTRTFIKYAKINVQEAEQLFQRDDLDSCMKKVESCIDALIKAVAAALPMSHEDFFSMKKNRFTEHLSDLCLDGEMPGKIADALFEARALVQKEKPNRETVKLAISRAEEAFRGLHDIFGSLDKFH